MQGEDDKTMEDVMTLFASLHDLELAHVANHVTEKDYISIDHFEAYLVSHTFLALLFLAAVSIIHHP